MAVESKSALDALQVPDEVCAHFKELGDYDYRLAREVADAAEGTAIRSVIDVDILGHIFEQSITDLERLRQNLEQAAPGKSPPTSQSPSPALAGTLSPAEGEREGVRGLAGSPDTATPGRRRKQEGAVYTPAFITRYLVEHALGGVLKARFKTLRRQHEDEAAGTARKALADPNAYDLPALNDPQRKALIRFGKAWHEQENSTTPSARATASSATRARQASAAPGSKPRSTVTSRCSPPTDFLAAITQHIPDKGAQMVRYHGWYSNKMRRVRQRGLPPELVARRPGVSPPPPAKLPSKRWPDLILRVWHLDPLRCPVCQNPMRVTAVIDDPRVVEQILRHVGAWRDPPPRPPPQGAPGPYTYEPCEDVDPMPDYENVLTD